MSCSLHHVFSFLLKIANKHSQEAVCYRDFTMLKKCCSAQAESGEVKSPLMAYCFYKVAAAAI